MGGAYGRGDIDTNGIGHAGDKVGEASLVIHDTFAMGCVLV